MAAIVIVVVRELNTPPQPKPCIEIAIKPTKTKTKKKKETKAKPKADPIVNEAKKQLMMFGHTATEAKEMLKGLNASTTQDYVNQALRKVKI